MIGKPVRVGERLMQIVDPGQVLARIEIPVADSIVLGSHAYVRFFLDANPLSSVPGRIISEGYQAETNNSQQLVYRVLAEIDASNDSVRIGAHGTARIKMRGHVVPFVYYLLRRPISAMRQHLGL